MTEKSFLDEMANNKPESFSQEEFQKLPKKKPVLLMAILGLFLLIIVMMFVVNRVQVPNFEGWTSESVGNWSKKHGLSIIASQHYHETIENGIVISQETPSGTKVSKKASLELSFSKGADPNQAIDFPELKTMTVDDIQTWINENKLTGVNIKYDYSDSFLKGDLISYEIVDGTESNLKRKSRIKISISKGSKSLSETLSMPDLYGKQKSEIKKWSVDNKINIEFQETFSDYVGKGYSLSQSIPKDSKITRTDPLIVVISKGMPISVPSFIGLTSSEANNLASLYNLRIFVKQIESSGRVGEVVFQDTEAGGEVSENTIITLHAIRPEETIEVVNFIGMTFEEAQVYAQLKGLKVMRHVIKSQETVNLVIQQSHTEGSKVNESDIVILDVSSGEVQVPKFVGLTKEQAEILVGKLGIKVNFIEVVSTHVRKNIVHKQSIEAGEVIKAEEILYLEVAQNQGSRVPDLSTYSKSEAELWSKTKGYTLIVSDVYDQRYENGALFDQNHKNIFLPASEVITVKHALGDVLIPSFVGQSKSEMMTWLEDVNNKGGDLIIDYKSVSSSQYEKGQITYQSKQNEYVEIKSKITVYVCTSKSSKGVLVPNLIGMKTSEFINWCNHNGLSYRVSELYHDTMDNGIIISQNKVNVTLDTSDILKVDQSIGKVTIQNFVGKTKDQVETWLRSVNSKGGRIAINYIEEASASVAKGDIINQSVPEGSISLGTTITITVSSGN